ncbi:MAG TPA: GDSL-type esterase/lipase family protein, partial [Thermoplasmata archaeon]
MPARRLTIVGLGDSTTGGTPFFRSPVEAPPDGAGDPEGQYSHWMGKLHPEWRVLNRGVNGERSDQVVRRLERDALAPRPEYVIVLAGVNDLYQGRGVEAVQAVLRTAYRRISESGIRLVGATVLPFDTASRRQAEAI